MQRGYASRECRLPLAKADAGDPRMGRVRVPINPQIPGKLILGKTGEILLLGFKKIGYARPGLDTSDHSVPIAGKKARFD